MMFFCCIDFNDVILRYFNDVNVIVNELLSSLKKIKKKKLCMFFNLVYYRNS